VQVAVAAVVVVVRLAAAVVQVAGFLSSLPV
jgi:hypothetical protein